MRDGKRLVDSVIIFDSIKSFWIQSVIAEMYIQTLASVQRISDEFPQVHLRMKQVTKRMKLPGDHGEAMKKF